MVNKVILIGNLGRDPEVRHLESGASVAKFSVATNENYKDKSGEWQTITQWHDVVAWRGLAERAERDLKKGSMVFVEGKLTTRKWQDKDGNDRYTTEVYALMLRGLDRREATNNLGGGGFPSASDEIPTAVNKPAVDMPSTTTSMDDDDLPF